MQSNFPGLGLVLVEFEYEYKDQNGVLVTIKPNERYVLLAKTNDHWWHVRNDSSSKAFYIPAKYVKELPTDFPSLLDFADKPGPDPVPHPVVAPVPVPVPVPVPKSLEEPGGSKTKQNDEVTIRLRPDTSNRHHRNENRMSTFGVPLDLPDLAHVSPRQHLNPHFLLRLRPPQRLMGSSVLYRRCKIPGKSGLCTRPAVEKNSTSSFDFLHKHHVKQQNSTEIVTIQSKSLLKELKQLGATTILGTADAPKPSSPHLGWVNKAPVGHGRATYLQLKRGIHQWHQAFEAVSKARSPLVRPSTPTSAPSSPQDEWQVYTDQESGRRFFYHPLTRQTTWSDLRGQTPAGDMDLSSPLSPASSKGSCEWEELLDETSGRVYYHNHKTGTTSWALPDPTSPLSPAGSTGSRNQDDVQTYLNLFKRTQQQWRLCLYGTKEFQSFPVFPAFLWFDLQFVFPAAPADSQRPAGRPAEAAGVPESVGHLLEKAGIVNKTKLVDHGKKLNRKNWTQSWTVLHGGILTFHKDPKFSPAGNTNKASQIVPEYTVDLKGASVQWAAKDKSSKKFVLELKTRQGCEYLIQYDTESIISDWHKVIQEAIQQLTPHQLVQQHTAKLTHPEPEHLSEDEDDSDREDKKRGSTRSNSGADSEQSRIRSKLRRFLQRRPTLQSVKEKGYIRDNVFGCHLDVLCHRENSIVPKFVEKCIKTVERRGLDVDGIYRVSGNLAVIQRLRHKADHEEHLDLEDGQWEEIHVITGALKLFFRELPEPLFPFCCFDKFIVLLKLSDYSQRVSYTKDLVCSLPLPNYETMKLLFKHLRRVIDHKDSNRMSVQSVAIVFGPTLLRPQIESANMTVHMVFQSQIVELMLNKFNEIFTET
uniref:Rho GTPase activating protein 27, like n=1 Tax=Poecilia formosa TaxID=48698 RepID=A0A087YIM9_POEFO